MNRNKDKLNRKLNEMMSAAGEWVPPTNLADIRGALLKLTADRRRAGLLAVAQGADCSMAVVEFCWEAGLLSGYEYELGGFTRKLHLVIDNPK